MTDRTTKTFRRTTAIGVTAGVLGGGAVGLMLGVPALTSAASDDVTTIVAQQADTDTATDTDMTDVTRPEPGARLRAALQDLVDDGTISATQADAVAQHLSEQWAGNRDERRERRMDRREDHRERRGERAETLAEALGTDVESLREQLRAGSSVAEIAEANGVELDTVVQVLVAEAEEHLDDAVADGRLTEEEAATRLEQITERITDRVQQVPGEGR